MSVIIPIRPQAEPALPDGGPAGGIKIPLRLGAFTQGGTYSQAERAILTAVSAAVAMRAPKAAAEAADEAHKDPGSLVPHVEPGDLADVIASVRRVQKGREKAPTPTDDQKLVADGLGVSAALVATAHRATERRTALESAIAWSATLDHALLARAVRVSVSRGFLYLADPGADESRVVALEKRVDRLESVLNTLVKTGSGVEVSAD